MEKMKKLENVKCTLYDLKYGERHWKTLKMRIAHYRTWIMGRNLKNMQNETQTLYDLEYSRNTEKRGKGEMLTMGPGIWWENWNSWKCEMGTLGPGIWQETLKMWKMKNAHCRTGNMVKNLKTVLMRNVQCMTCNMARNTENCGKWEMVTVGPGKWHVN